MTREAEFANERQMADYMALHAKDEEDFKNKAADMMRASEAKIYSLERASSVMLKAMANDFKSGQAQLDRDTQDRIRAAQKALADKIAKEKKKNNQMRKAIGAVKVVAGVVIGVVTSWTGVGAAAGASLAVQGASEMA